MGDWPACLSGLDRARAMDPNGDEMPAVQAQRRAAVAGGRAEGGAGGEAVGKVIRVGAERGEQSVR